MLTGASSIKKTIQKPRVKRPHKKSRKGCLSCKKLRIKCDEARPVCEYCASTNKVCEYVSDPPENTDGTVLVEIARPKATASAAHLKSITQAKNPSVYSTTVATTLQQPSAAPLPIVGTAQTAKVPSSSTVTTISETHDDTNSDETGYEETSASSSSTVSQELITYTFVDESSHNNGIPPSPKPPVSQSFRNIPYGEILDFHRTHVSANLALTEQKIFHAWNHHVPQMAYHSPMVAHAVVAYSALTKSKNMPARDPSLEFLASTNFNAAIRLLSPALPKMNAGNYENIHITSCLVAAYAFIDPDVAPLASNSPNSPDLFGILRGAFNISAFAYAELAKNSPIAVTFLQPAVKIPTLEDLKTFDTTGKNIGYFKLLLDQLFSMDAGSTDISILCEPINVTRPAENMPAESTFKQGQRQPSPQTESEKTGLSDLQSKFSPRNPDTDDNEDDLEYLHKVNSRGEDPYLYSFLPGEFEAYRVVIYSLMFMAQEAVRLQRPSLLTGSLNAPPDDYLQFLRHGRPMAIVIAAFMLGQYKFMMEFPDFRDSFVPRLRMLEASLHPDWRPALYWPKRILEEGIVEHGLLQLMKDLHLR